MRQLEKLIIDAQIITEPEAEVERVMQVCNACRYCEGFCAVFPAMTQRLEFGKADINYLANLCHNCGACLHACQYAPPHEFAINVPKAMAEVRLETYQHYAQPAAFGALYRRAGVTVTLALVFSLILFLLLAMGLKGSLLHPPLAGDFYQIFPHNLLAWMFGSVFILAIGLLMAGVIRFWREISPGMPRSVEIAEASHDALTLKYLDGGHGKGCNDADDALSVLQRSGHAGHVRRHWPGCRPGWLAMAQSQALTATWRRTAKTDGSRFYFAAAADQSDRFSPAGRKRLVLDGYFARHSPRRGHGALSDHSLRKICPWILPLRSLTQVGD